MLTGAAPRGQLGADDLSFVQRLVHDGSGMVLDQTKAYLVHTRLAPLAARHGVGDVAQLIAELRSGCTAQQAAEVVQAMTINETSFFRDVHPWRSLAEDVLPDLVLRRAASRRLVLWSGACSTGQEPYSIAILLQTAFPQLASWDIRILATDISAEVLDRARSGIYTAHEVARGLPPALLRRHAEQRPDGSWQLSPATRAMVRFTAMNIAGPWPEMPVVDVLVLRNVLIYFDLATKRAVLQRARAQLADDGVMILGGVESPSQIDEGWVREGRGQTAWFRPRTGVRSRTLSSTGTSPVN